MHQAASAAPAPQGSRGAPIVAPPVTLALAPPPPITTAPAAGNGGAASSGAGTGAGGSGTGSGGGGSGGSGAGGNPNASVAALPRQVAGRMLYSDLPEDLRKARAGGEVTVRYRIGTDGLVSGCTVIASSGRPDLDAATCDHISRRFRFRPARDAAGNPVPFIMTETQGWNNFAQ
ncbi:energy transducer TonB [Novosphingobium sp. BL-8H]|uniref:energy transducer TonB n=1 Tax=Novosphingobium sp. BL-8H TaxID=3127640 RepID=UPI0037576A29